MPNRMAALKKSKRLKENAFAGVPSKYRYPVSNVTQRYFIETGPHREHNFHGMFQLFWDS